MSTEVIDDHYFFKNLIEYKKILELLEKQSEIAEPTVIDLLLLRDKIEKSIDSKDLKQQNAKELLQLASLDKRLIALGDIISECVDLTLLRKTLNRLENNWWWYFTPPLRLGARFDWVWNALTAGALALSASFMYNIYTAFAAGNADFATALSTIIQVAGLTLVGGGALTNSGKQKVQKALNGLNVPKQFYAEATFGMSLILLLFAFMTNDSIDDVFIKDGQHKYEQGQLSNARIAYLQAKEINPKDILIHDKLAQIHESEGDLNQAAKQYMVGSAKGNVNSLLGLGRVLINENDVYPEWNLSEAYLLMGLQRAYADSSTSPYTYYQLNRNIGWVLIQQQQYPAAIQYLEKAITWRKKVKNYSTSGGTGNCFLAYAYEQNSQAQQATDNWKKCVQYGKPDYIHEYRWLLTIGKRDVAFCVDTSSIVGGYKGEKSPEVSKQCQQLFRY